ncbi:MAG: hypothetical protein WD845_01730 [Pirellulales bacterium]
MSSTSQDRARDQAGGLFDEVVAPLAAARQAAGQQAFFPRAGQSNANSYYDDPLVRVMCPADFEFPGGGTADGLIDALAEYWMAEGENGLAAMAPRLKEIAEALSTEAAEGDGTISILCYTMF